MIKPFEAWTLARAVAGLELNGELNALAGPFKAMATHLNDLPKEGRAAAWQTMLAVCDDGPALIKALAGVDPLGPPPEADEFESAQSEWPPLRYASAVEAEPFPLDVLPDPVARFVREGAAAIGCPPDFLALPVLAVAGGVIGRSVSLLLKPGYFASATIFGACVGPPSDGKTPALKMVAAAVRGIDLILEAEQEQALERWREEAAQSGPDDKKLKPPPPPKPRRIDVDDITLEALPLILADNPRGLVMIRDELTAFVLGLNQYKAGKGNDRSNVLKLWSGDAIKKDRVAHENREPIRSPHPCLSLVGGLTPDMLGELADPKGRADGFLDRFLLACPEPMPVAGWNRAGLPEDVANDWQAVVARLWARPMSEKDGNPVPHVARFTPEGLARWESHYAAHVDEMNGPHFPPSMRGPWGKFREYAGRLALILALLDHAADPTADPLAVPDVGPLIVDAAWRLVAYFKSHARRVHGAISHERGIGGGPVVLAIVKWIQDKQRTAFTERDIKQAREWIKPDDLTAALEYLAKVAAIRPVETPAPSPKGGRPSSPSYDVNPALHVLQNPQNLQNPDQGEG